MTGNVPKKKNSIGTVLLNAPHIVWSAIFILVPLLIVVYFAFTDADGAFTIDNFKLFLKPEYVESFFTALVYSAIATVISLVIAYPFAFVMSRLKSSSQRLMMMLVMLPMWISLLIRTNAWALILEQNGIINNMIKFLGFESITFMGTPGAVILVMVYNYLPYMILPIYTVISKIEKPLLEAADDLGCNGFQKFVRVILPLSMPGIVSGITMVFVPAISTFYISSRLTDSKLYLIGNWIDWHYYSDSSPNNYNVVAMLSLVLMVFILITLAILNKFSDDDEGGIVL